ncbi:MAG: hypothetical protein RR048_00200 [Oscillospiraceae bacterium]
MNENKSIYRFPPRFSRQFLICGLTIWEVIITVFGILISAVFIKQGIFLPCFITITFYVLRCRLFDERNAYDGLKIRFRHFYSDNIFSLNDTGGKKTNENINID